MPFQAKYDTNLQSKGSFEGKEEYVTECIAE